MTVFVLHIRSIPVLFIATIIVLYTYIPSSWAELPSGQRKPTKTVVVIHCDYYPVSLWDTKTDRPSGFVVDVMDAVAKRAGLQVSYFCRHGWGEMINAIESGEAALGALLKSEEREKRLLFSAPIDVTYLSYFARSQSRVDADSLPQGHTIGVVKGSMSYEQLKGLPGVNLHVDDSYKEGLFDLLAGEIGLLAGEESMILKSAREARLEDRIKKVGKPFSERERGFAVKKDNVQLVDLLNKALYDFTRSPEYQRIYIRWYGTPIPYWTNRRILIASAVFLLMIVCGMALWRYMSITKINKELLNTIAAREQTEGALRSSENRYKAIVENQAEFVVRYLSGGVVTFINDTFCKYLAMKRDALLGKSYYPYMYQDDRESFVKRIESLNSNNPSMVAEARVVLIDGRIAWHKWTHNVICDEDGNINEYQATGRDITDQKNAVETLRQSEEMTRKVLDSVDEGFILIDRDYRILTTNRAFCKQVDLFCEDIIGKHCYEISHRIQQPCYETGEECAVKKVFETGNPSIAYHQHTDASGNILYVETKAFPLKDSSGAVNSVIESISDITEKHLLQEERLRTQKLEATGMLAGGIAHDFNNLLQGVFGYISLARLTADDRDKSFSSLEQAEKALQMTVKLTNQLLTFSKGGKPLKRLIDLRPVIENATKFAMSGSRSEYHLEIDNQLWAVEADEGQIGQVIQNIVLNADQAMPMRGTVFVAAKNICAPGPGIPVQLKAGAYTEVSVSDSGVGIPEQYLPRIFDPYFTTKEKGSGLGLAMSYSIIKNHSGLIDVKSEREKGSTFLIYLPAVVTEQETSHQNKSAEFRSARAYKVLLMDDQQIILDVAGKLLEALGHEVEFAAHGAEAIEKYQASRQTAKPFDILILDLTVRGGMGGIETLEKLRKTYPEAKAIVSSGYSDDSALSEYRSYGFVGVLKKPYTTAGLKAVLDEALK